MLHTFGGAVAKFNIIKMYSNIFSELAKIDYFIVLAYTYSILIK